MNTAHFHPMLVHFPVAIILVGFVVELASWFWKKEHWLPKASLILLLFGTLSALAGYLSGEFFTNELTGEAGKIKDLHELFAKITLGMMILVSLLKIIVMRNKNENKGLQFLVLVLYAIGAALVSYTGFLGGTMVMNYMIGL
jgi:uncharacterized membrane protein